MVIATASHFGGTVRGSGVEEEVEMSVFGSNSNNGNNGSNNVGAQQYAWEIGLYHATTKTANTANTANTTTMVVSNTKDTTTDSEGE